LPLVAGNVKPDPAAAVFHVLLEGRPLLRSLRKIVQPQDQPVRLEVSFVELCPVRSSVKHKIILCRQIPIEGEGVVGSVYVIRFDIRGVESEYLETGVDDSDSPIPK